MDIRKFTTNGYEVVVLNRADVLKSIDKNILDKDVAMAIIDKCDKDIAQFISEGRWAGIPFIGNLRVPPAKLLEQTIEQQALIEDAKRTLNNKEYIAFRHKLAADNASLVAEKRLFNYLTTIAINMNRRYYKKLCIEQNKEVANIVFYFFNFIQISNGQEFDNRFDVNS